MQLTAEQQRAVQSWQRGDICVVAGPGSGKTRVLVERLRWLIAEQGVQPERILAITFTEKAAREMQGRLAGESAASPEHRSLFESAQVSTIDAFCGRLLRENALEAGVDPGFEMLDEAEAQDLLSGAIEQALDEAFAKPDAPLRQFLASYAAGPSQSSHGDASAVQRDLAGLVYRIRSYGCKPFLGDPAAPLADLAEALRALAQVKDSNELAAVAETVAATSPADPSELAATLESVAAITQPIRKQGRAKPLVAEIKDRLLPACRTATVSAANRPARQRLLRLARRVLTKFDAAKRVAGRLDFDDALAKAAQLLEAGNSPRLAFEHILIDEFQDTNPLQVRLVERLLDAHGPQRPVRFVAGDINQSIYGFRHADQNVFRGYRERIERQDGDVIRLLDNFRSRPEILSAVHRILPGGGASGVEEHRLNAASQFPPKQLPSVEVQIVSEAGGDPGTQEALRLAERLHALKGELYVANREAGSGSRPLRWGDIAILVRTHATAAVLATALRTRGVPCLTRGDRGLFDAPETAELAALLRVLRNPRDEISLAAVLKSPFCGISDAALLQLRLGHDNISTAVEAESPLRASLEAESATRLTRFRQALALCRADRATVPVRYLLARAIAACGYRTFLASSENGDAAVVRVDQLLEWAAKRQERGLLSLGDVSAALDRALEARPPAHISPDQIESDESVHVLTMHAAKGLEFPVVVLASLQSRPSRQLPGLLFSEEHGIGARWRQPFQSGPNSDAAYSQTSADLAQREGAEAERLLYVAMTRAEEHLILSMSFGALPQNRGWCAAVLAGLGIDAKEDASGELEERMAGDLRLLYRKTTGAISGRAESRAVPDLSEPEVLSPRRPEAQADYTATVTSIVLFADCPRKYFLSRYLGLGADGAAPLQSDDPQAGDARRKRRDDIDPSELGRQVHEHLAGDLADPSPEVRAMAGKFWSHALGIRAIRADPVEKEMAFVFTVGEFLLRGTIDLLFEEGGERLLVDYKTDRRSPSGLAAAAQQYAPQLQLYAAGLAKADRPADRAVVFYLRHGTPIDIEIGPEAIENAERLVEEFFTAQRLQRYPLHVGAHCRHCPHYQRACPAQLS